MIPIHIKIYKLLINELSNAMETNMSQQASAGGEDLEVGHCTFQFNHQSEYI